MIAYTVDVYPETDVIPENDIDDAEIAADIRDRIRRGDVWAWCVVKVTAWCDGKEIGSDYLGACSYADEAEFVNGDYYADMCRDAAELGMRK